MHFRRLFLFLLLSAGIPEVMGQCQLLNYSVADSACAASNVVITNNPVAGYSYEWDFCPGDLETVPSGRKIPNPGFLNFPQQVAVINDNGNYYVFLANQQGGNVIRFDFGTSIQNNPVTYDYGNFGLLAQPSSLSVIQESGNWYLFTVDFITGKFLRVDLGNSIAANTSSVTDLGNFSFNAPRGMKITKDQSEYFAFVTNAGSTDIHRFSFGTSILNTPVFSGSVSAATLNGNVAVDVEYDCLQNKYFLITTCFFASNINIFDFGSSLSGTPNLITTIPLAFSPSGSVTLRDGSDWHVLAMDFSNNKLHNFKFSSGLQGPSTVVFADTVGQMSNPFSMSVIKDGNGYVGAGSSIGDNSISLFQWEAPCAISPQISTDPSLAQFTASGSGYQQFGIQVTDQSGYTTDYADSVFVNPLPSISFSNGLACDGYAVQFNDNSSLLFGSLASWLWDFDDQGATSPAQNPSHIFSSATIYNITLTATSASGCSASNTIPVTVNPTPVSSFLFTNNQCSGYDVPFSDNSSVPGAGTVTGWEWTFGDNSTSVLTQNPLHTYDTAGIYTVQLIVTAQSGCSDTSQQNIDIIFTPEPLFTVTGTCAGETASFQNNTFIPSGQSLTNSWNFGDGNTSSLTSPTHQYPASPSNYQVYLATTASNGCSDTLYENIRISSKPIPSFNFSPALVCVNNPVSFTSTSTGTGTDTISQYIWDFGDLNTSALQNPIHAYADTGYFNVTLTVVSPTYCDSSITLQVYVVPSPTATFTAQNQCLGTPIQFNPFIQTPQGTQVDSVVWDFGDGSFFNGITSPAHTYSSPGDYIVNVTVYNNLLCTGGYSDTITVYPLPVADFTNTLACSGSEITFDGTGSTISSGIINSWLWSFGAQGTGTDSIETFIFNNAGNYTVSLIATSGFGCTDTIVKSITAIQSPDFDFTFTDPCFGEPASFTYIDNITPPQPANLLWNFGDNSTSSLLNPIHLYADADSFNVTLIVLNPNTGCSAIKEKQLIVRPLPNTGFTSSSGCEDVLISFNDTSSILTGNIATWNWSFGSSGTSSLQDPDFAFNDPGNYTITLTATSDFGCTGTANSTIEIYPNPSIAFTPDPLYGSPPLTVNFLNSSQGATSYSWNFDDGGISSATNPSHVFLDTGMYVVTLTGTSAFGCISSISQSISVLIPYTDISVEETYFTSNNGQIKVSAVLLNRGNITINNAEIVAFVDEGTPVAEVFTGQLKPGNSILYEFNATLLLSENISPKYVCVEARNPNNGQDDNPSNNLNCSVQNNDFEVFSAFPNPFHTDLSISINLPFEAAYSVEIYNTAGQCILRENNLTGLQGFNVVKLNTQSLAKGLYAVSVNYNDQTKVIKVIKN